MAKVRLSLAALLLVGAAAGAARADAPAKRHFLYVAAPGIRNYLEFGGAGILVFDIDDGHKFVRLADSGLRLIHEAGLDISPLVAKILDHVFRKKGSGRAVLGRPIGRFRRFPSSGFRRPAGSFTPVPGRFEIGGRETFFS